MKKYHKLTALILAAVMSVSMIPTAAFADEVGATEEVVIESTETESNLSEEEIVTEEKTDETTTATDTSDTVITEDPVNVTDDTEESIPAVDEQDSFESQQMDANEEDDEAILLGADSTGASATNVDSGTCGDNLTWTLSNGVLSISGTGEMTSSPWNKSEIYNIVIGSEVTNICEEAFIDCTNLERVTIPGNVKCSSQQILDTKLIFLVA